MRITRILLFKYLIVCWLVVAAVESYAEKVVLTAGSWPPFTGEELPKQGIAADIVKRAFQTQGVEVEFQFEPWARSMADAETGAVDGSILWRYTPERAEVLYYSDPVLTVDIQFFYLRGSPFDWDTLENLKSWKLGAVRGFKYDAVFDQMALDGELNIDYVKSQEQNLGKLLLGRIDATPIVSESGFWMIQNSQNQDIRELVVAHPKPLAKQELHLVLSRNKPENEELVKVFNKGLRALRQQANE